MLYKTRQRKVLSDECGFTLDTGENVVFERCRILGLLKIKIINIYVCSPSFSAACVVR